MTSEATTLRDRADSAYERRITSERNLKKMNLGRDRVRFSRAANKHLHVTITPEVVGDPEEDETVFLAANVDDVRLAWLGGERRMALLVDCKDCGDPNGFTSKRIGNLADLGEALDGVTEGQCIACQKTVTDKAKDAKRKLGDRLADTVYKFGKDAA